MNLLREQPYDVVIVGGSNAGLSAALVLGRSLRRVLLIDAGQPCNRQTPHSHGFLTRDGETPANLLAIAREQLNHYPTVQLLSDTVTTATQQPDGLFGIETANGGHMQSRKVVLATGVFDIMPDLPGFAECWGRSVLHCPYCHGYEVHGEPLGVLANGEVAYELATLIQHWSRHLTLYTNGPSPLSGEQRQVLAALAIPVVETPISVLEHNAGLLTALRFADGTTAAPKALFARVPFRQPTNLAEQLGCNMTESGLIDANEVGATNVPGLYAAGDCMSLLRQVAIAVASGVKAASWLNRELISDELRQQGLLV